MAEAADVRHLVVLDVDSTLIEEEAIELIAARAGSLDRVADITARAMNGELDFAASLRERVATLAGVPVSVLGELSEQLTVTQGVPDLIDAVHATGGRVAVVSGGFHELLDPLAARLGLDRHRANRLEVQDGVLTGRVDGPIVDAAAKAAALREWRDAFAIDPSAVVAVGDGANDLAMMDEAGLSVAFDAKPAVRARADVSLDVRDLSHILPLLGLRG